MYACMYVCMYACMHACPSSFATFVFVGLVFSMYPSFHSFQIVVNALVYSIPSIFNVLLVCMVFWLIFAIAGNQLFAGKFYRCEDGDSQRISASIVPNRTVCEIMINNGSNFRWYNPPINFDNTIVGFLALLQVVRWIGISL